MTCYAYVQTTIQLHLHLLAQVTGRLLERMPFELAQASKPRGSERGDCGGILFMSIVRHHTHAFLQRRNSPRAPTPSSSLPGCPAEGDLGPPWQGLSLLGSGGFVLGISATARLRKERGSCTSGDTALLPLKGVPDESQNVDPKKEFHQTWRVGRFAGRWVINIEIMPPPSNKQFGGRVAVRTTNKRCLLDRVARRTREGGEQGEVGCPSHPGTPTWSPFPSGSRRCSLRLTHRGAALDPTPHRPPSPPRPRRPPAWPSPSQDGGAGHATPAPRRRGRRGRPAAGPPRTPRGRDGRAWGGRWGRPAGVCGTCVGTTPPRIRPPRIFGETPKKSTPPQTVKMHSK